MNNEQVRAAALEVEYPMPAAQNNALERFKAVDNRAAFLKGWDRALATTAAPERSGKLADEVVGVIVADDPVYGWHIRALKPWDQIGAGTKLYTRAPEADSSSAAPIALSKQLRSVYAAYNGHGEELKGICDQAADELDRLAAPSPTRESLNEKPCVGCNGAGVIGTPGMPCPFCPVEKKLREFEAALATPRQTEDGGLSAALAEEVADVLMSQNWRGDLVERLRDVAASTFAPKEPAVQGGVPGDWEISYDRWSQPGTIRLASAKWGGTFLSAPPPGCIRLPSLVYHLLADMLAAAPTGASHGE